MVSSESRNASSIAIIRWRGWLSRSKDTISVINCSLVARLDGDTSWMSCLQLETWVTKKEFFDQLVTQKVLQWIFFQKRQQLLDRRSIYNMTFYSYG